MEVVEFQMVSTVFFRFRVIWFDPISNLLVSKTTLNKPNTSFLNVVFDLHKFEGYDD